jgi:Xaa-Pro aminopeptidase
MQYRYTGTQIKKASTMSPGIFISIHARSYVPGEHFIRLIDDHVYQIDDFKKHTTKTSKTISRWTLHTRICRTHN